MRINRDFLIKTARDQTARRLRVEKDVLAAYLCGSVLLDEPLLGGTADIDIVLIHAGTPKIAREIVRLNEDIHLDIAHHSESVYQQPRALRVDPWVGTAAQNHPVLLHDVRHWFEFTQASLGSQFYRSDHTAARARVLLNKAREAWAQLSESRAPFIKKYQLFASAVENGANAAACLTGTPLCRRRFLSELPARLENSTAAGLTAGLISLLGFNQLTTESLQAILPDWEQAFNTVSAQPGAPADLQPVRLKYYRSAALEYLERGDVPAAAYPLFATWCKTAGSMPATSPEYLAWLKAEKEIGLSKETLPEKIAALDAYLDHVEEVVDAWDENAGG